ncbi:Na+/H+ antiporter [Streptomyces bathyalis]|uniref:Na+/H+ antiporter n=1 Tax=Streptomyces bathyalis TaxID=2710756 RepID=A0A7T1T637_9ACTN|nr:Na+/H+ antiporter [Streptomyces bathyalis]QPP07108.1 Na+/H+ antiporter [Streptomyces bathyalis]
MVGLEIVVVLLFAVLALSWTARRLGLSEPVFLLLGGVVIGVAGRFPPLHLPADVVLLIFLPPLLYAESLTISLHQARANLRVIVLTSVGLVLITAVTVAGTAYAFGLAWPIAFVLGAVLAPTDATAVASVARGLPRRAMTMLRAESLVNDGTALVLFAVAVEIATGETSFAWGPVIWDFVLSYAGGVGIGATVALLVILVRRRLHDATVESGLSVLTPFAAYLPAELAEVSGVLAVVVCGLIVSRAGPTLVQARSRVQTFAFWGVTTFLLNGTLFVLVGVQLPAAVTGLRTLTLGEASALAAAVAATVIGTRLLYGNTMPYVIRALDRRPLQRARRVPTRQRMPLAWAGVRGAISLAAALAVPVLSADGSRLAGRDVIVFVTAAVILVTLVLQGQTLPAVIRWARLPPDPDEESEELLARRRIVDTALRELPGEAARVGAPQHVTDRLGQELREHADDLDAGGPRHEHEHELRSVLLRVKRDALVALRDAHDIDDAVLRRVQAGLDAEELRLELREGARRVSESAGGGPDRDGSPDGGPDEGEDGPDTGGPGTGSPGGNGGAPGSGGPGRTET